MKSKMAINPDEPSLGRICADHITPPHMPDSIIRCIRRVESIPQRITGNIFADTSCDTPLTEGHISVLRSDGFGRGIDESLAIVFEEYLESSIPDGRYTIRSQVENRIWSGWPNDHMNTEGWTEELAKQKYYSRYQVN
jgi:hypothetical protein